ncbi:hypothetical protein H7827_28595 [Streptomyces sp. JH002]|uniref:hypothetical protein n=1 Tax=Streptomyces sp. JH002 TaxID=2763259 RepID=UPI003D8004AA
MRARSALAAGALAAAVLAGTAATATADGIDIDFENNIPVALFSGDTTVIAIPINGPS